MKQFKTQLGIAVFFLFVMSSTLYAHCEIPCGIYDDKARITLLAEHIATMEKSMGKIIDLQKNTAANSNQLVRWVMNKEDHANQFQEIVTQYFMTQRIKPDQKDYEKKLVLLHKMLLEAMKSKQTVDMNHTAGLRTLLGEFEKLYFAPH